MAEAVLLLLLAERPQHGYELATRIGEEELVAGRVRAGRVYETLARLAELGFVEAQHEQSPAGPDRWRYRLTPAGLERLARWRSGLERSWRRIGYFIHRYDHQFGVASEPRDRFGTEAPAQSSIGPQRPARL